MKRFQKALLAPFLMGAFVHAADVQVRADDIFKKPTLPRVTEEKVKKATAHREQEFDTAKDMRYVLIPAALVATAFVALNWGMMKNMAISGRDNVVAAGETVSGAAWWVLGRPMAFYNWMRPASPVTDPSLPIQLAPTVERAEFEALRNAQVSLEGRVSYVADIVAEMAKNMSPGLFTGLMAHMGFTFASNHLNKGIEYVHTKVSEDGAQDVKLFLTHSTKLSKIKSDFRGRYQKLQESKRRSVLMHYRKALYELSERLINDTTRVIAFMYTVNAYNELGIESIETQVQMLMDEANDLAARIEYKLEEFDHTADATKSQAALKDIIISSLNFMTLLENEINGFAILIDPDQEEDDQE